jgi:dTDP-4-amino-4,6-dideoxygalactose transaminase
MKTRGFRIPFNRPFLAGRELDCIREAVMDGKISGDGLFTDKCSELLEKELKTRPLLTTSCTAALEMAAMLLVKPLDEVIVPSFTFVSTVNAFVLRGAKPIFADIRRDTLNLDEARLERYVSPRTKVIVPVHYAGVACEMLQIDHLAAQVGAYLVEDNAHGLFGKYHDKYLGTIGALGTLSFHETKNFTCGEGGALLVNDRTLLERAEIIREKGTDRSKFIRGQVDKYTWVDVGSSYLPSDILAAFLYAQLRERETIMTHRRRVWSYYHECLKDWTDQHGIRRPTIPENCESAHHMYHLVLRSEKDRDGLIDHLKGLGILAVSHYVPLHLSKMGRHFGGRHGMCPVTEEICPRLIRLPFFNDMTVDEQDQVIDAVLNWRA